MKGYSFLFWAYTIVWAGIAAYVAVLGSRLARLHRRLAALEREAGRAGEGQRSASDSISSQNA